jgi:ribosome-associated translation inhibitor RaiA
MIKKVASFQTSDGALHASQIQALRREFHIELQAVLNKASLNKAFSSSEVATLLHNNADSFLDVLRKYKDKIRREEAKGSTTANNEC